MARCAGAACPPPLARYGQISELRLVQICAVAAPACMSCPETKTPGIQEPNLLGLSAGANVIYAETSGHRGMDIAACKRMFFETGVQKREVSRGEIRNLVF